MTPEVQAVLDGLPAPQRRRLVALRTLILETATAADVGPLTETLKWGEPAYLPKAPRTGTTVRINAVKGRDDQVALYFHCQTTLVEDFRARHPGLSYEGNRAVILPVDGPLPDAELRDCIAQALTYHRRKRAA
jgi:hypothetical protein